MSNYCELVLELFLLCADSLVAFGGVVIFPAGTEMVGELERSGIGTPTLPGREVRPIEHSRTTCVEHNTKLKQSLREDVDSDWLLEATKADARLGRMSDPTPWDDRHDTCLLHPRFVATQNQADGSVKRRAVDHSS